MADEMVRVCREGQGRIGPQRARAGLWNQNATPDFIPEQHAINVLAGTPFWDEVLAMNRSGTVLAGASAGAMMLGEKTYAPDDFDAAGFPQSVSVRDGLGVLGGHFVIPHFDLLAQFPIERVRDWITVWPQGLRGIGIDEDTAIVEGADGWTVRGRGQAVTMTSYERRQVHRTGERFDSIPILI